MGVGALGQVQAVGGQDQVPVLVVVPAAVPAAAAVVVMGVQDRVPAPGVVQAVIRGRSLVVRRQLPGLNTRDPVYHLPLPRRKY